MATNNKDFIVKNGLIVGDSTNLVNYSSASPSGNFLGQLWINEPYLYAWSSASTWVLIGDGNTGGVGGSASGTPFNISNTLVARSASGTFSISAIDLDTTASPALSVGRIQWNPNFGTPEVGLVGGNVTAHIGQHVHAYVTNAEGSPLVKGDVVYLYGASGDRASVKKASNTSDTTSSKTLGVAAEAIGTGQNGFVTVFGVVDTLNLSSYSSGDVLWLSSSAGKFTNIKPSAPQHLVFIGVVARANPGNGQLFVNVQNGYELEELHSVTLTNVTDNDILAYNGSSSLWFNQNLATAIQEVDGVGSGIDADLLDGQQGSYYLDWTNTTNKPDPIIGVNLIGNTTGAASATLTDLTNGQISITTNTTFATSASSIDWTGVTNKPGPIVGVNLIGEVTGAASATLTDLANGQISITTAAPNYLRFDTASTIYVNKTISTITSTSAIYRLTLSDAGKLLEMNVSASNTILIPINASAAFPIGTKIDILQTGAGSTTASFDAGVTLNSDTNYRTLNGQWAAASLIKRDTDTWVIIGALK